MMEVVCWALLILFPRATSRFSARAMDQTNRSNANMWFMLAVVGIVLMLHFVYFLQRGPPTEVTIMRQNGGTTVRSQQIASVF